MDRDAMWRTRLTEYAESGLGQKAFCEQRGYSAKALRHWARKLHFVLPGVAGGRNGAPEPGGRAEEFLCSTPEPSPLAVRSWGEPIDGRLRRSWTDEGRLALLQDALQSGVSLDRYAKMNSLAPSALYRWYHRFSTQIAERPDDPLGETPAFASVEVRDPAPAVTSPPADPVGTRTLEIVLRNGRVLRFTAGVDLHDAVRLANALEAGA